MEMKKRMKDKLTEHFNSIYASEGFYGVIEEVDSKLEYGSVEDKGDGLFCVTTGGWSDDEEILDSLTSFLSIFGYKHYVGRLRGGAYYFYEERFGDWEIQKVLSDKETCNPQICKVCEYSSNGKRDAARSITMCDGCRYNEEFKLK